MAPKRPNPMEDPPAASSTEEEEENSTSSEDSSSSEEEEEEESPPKPSSPPPPPPPSQKQQQQQPPKKQETTPATPHPQSSASESEESESESEESDSEKTPKPTGAADPNVKPIATKPMEETPKTTKPRSKLAATSVKSAAKRPIENDRDSKDSKKPKKGSDDGVVEGSSKKSTEDPKKQLFQRLWSEDDEIAVLKGMFEYSAKKGVDPMADMNAFLDYIKNSLHFDVTKVQLHDKIRRLKKKYENNLSKGKKGEDRSFSKTHEQKTYDLSKKVWGGEGVESSVASKLNGKSARKTLTPKPNGKALPIPKLLASPEGKKMEIDGNEGESGSISDMVLFDKNIGASGMDEYVLKRGLELVDGSKRAELEERWKKLQLAQLELFVERSGLIFEQAKLMLEAAKSSNQ